MLPARVPRVNVNWPGCIARRITFSKAAEWLLAQPLRRPAKFRFPFWRDDVLPVSSINESSLFDALDNTWLLRESGNSHARDGVYYPRYRLSTTLDVRLISPVVPYSPEGVLPCPDT